MLPRLQAVLPREYDPELRPDRLAPLDRGFTYTDGKPIAVVHPLGPLLN